MQRQVQTPSALLCGKDERTEDSILETESDTVRKVGSSSQSEPEDSSLLSASDKP